MSDMAKARQVELMIDGVAYIAIPRPEYLRLTRPRSEAVKRIDKSIGASLRKARSTAKLSPARLAELVKRPPAFVLGVEAGREVPTPAYVRKVLKACGLPLTWAG